MIALLEKLRLVATGLGAQLPDAMTGGDENRQLLFGSVLLLAGGVLVAREVDFEKVTDHHSTLAIGFGLASGMMLSGGFVSTVTEPLSRWPLIGERVASWIEPVVGIAAAYGLWVAGSHVHGGFGEGLKMASLPAAVGGFASLVPGAAGAGQSWMVFERAEQRARRQESGIRETGERARPAAPPLLPSGSGVGMIRTTWGLA